jgi:hypothetical protein
MSTAPTSHGRSSRRVAAQSGQKPEFSANPQDSSSQALNTIQFLKPKSNSVSCSDERGGKVEKRPCNRQVFASEAVAFNSARMLRGIKIAVKPERCAKCGLMHLSRDNGGPDQP